MYVYNSWNKVSTDDLSGLNEHSFYNPRDSVLYVAYDGELMTQRTDSIYEYLQADSNIDQLLYPDWEKMRLLCLSDSMILELDLTTLARDTILSLEELPSYGITNYDLSKMIVIRDMYDTTKLNIRFHQWNSSSYPVLQIDNNSEHWSVVDTLKREYFSRNSKGDYIKLDGGTVSVIDAEGKVIYTKDLTRSGFIDRY